MNKSKLFIERLQKRKEVEENVIKLCLSSRVKNKDILSLIREIVPKISKIIHRGSLVFNQLLLYCLNEDQTIPDFSDISLFERCFRVGIEKYKTRGYELIQDVFKKYFQDFPLLGRFKGDTQIIQYAAKTYQTNFKNMLIVPFEKRLKTFLKEYSRRYETNNISIYVMMDLVIGKKKFEDYELNEKLLGILGVLRIYLKIKDSEVVTKIWKEKNLAGLLNFYHYLIMQNEAWKCKNFTIAPISSIKNHFITIDSVILRELMINIDLLPAVNKSRKFTQEEILEDWNNLFKIKNCNGKEFSRLIQTDGVSLCIHYQRPKRISVIPSFPTNPQRIIGIDPGRVNIQFGVDSNGEEYKLTRKQYYQQSGMVKNKKKVEKWNLKNKEIMIKLSKNSSKSNDLTNYLTIVSENYDKLWNNQKSLKWSRERMHLWIGKNRTLDRFYASMGKGAIIAYGSAKFAPTGPGELAVPTSSAFKRCSKHFKIKLIDEFRTSKMCNSCEGELTKLFIRDEEIRGFRQCCSIVCQRKLVGRDSNAAKNIRDCYLERPNCLRRNWKDSGISSRNLSNTLQSLENGISRKSPIESLVKSRLQPTIFD